MGDEVVRRRREQAMRGQPATSDMDSMRRFTDGSGPMPKDWSPGNETYGSGNAGGMTTMTPDQQQAIRDAESRPTAQQVVNAGQQGNWIENQAAVNDATAKLGGMFIGEGYNDRPTWTEESRLAGEALNRGLDVGREQKAAMDQRDAEIERLRAVQTDPAGAEMYARYQKGDIAGYEITSNPNISPYWKRRVAEEPVGSLDPSRYGKAQLPGSSSRAGASPAMLRSESMQQMTLLANRMAEGRGGLAIRTALSNYQAALATGDQTAINSATTELESMLQPMFDRFQSRFDKEAGAGVGDLKKQFMDQLRGRLMSGTAGVGYRGGSPAQQYPQSPPMPGQDSGSRGASSRSTQTSSQGGVQVQTTPSGGSFASFDSRRQFLKAMESGDANLKPGMAIRVGGDVLTPVATGTGEFAFMPAMMFGSKAMPHPSSFRGGSEWVDSLDDEQRQALLDSMATESRVRSLLPRSVREEVDKVRNSRFGYLNQAMNPRDREKALMDLKANEDALLSAAVYSSLSNVGAANAMTETGMRVLEAEGDAAAKQPYRDAERTDAMRTEAEKSSLESVPIGHDAESPVGGSPVASPSLSMQWRSLSSSQRTLMGDIIANMSLVDRGEDIASALSSSPGVVNMSNEELLRVTMMVKQNLHRSDPTRFVAEVESLMPGFAKQYLGSQAQVTDSISKSREMFDDRVAKLPENPTREQAIPVLSEMFHQLIVGGAMGRLSGDRIDGRQSERDLYGMIVNSGLTQEAFVNYMLARMSGDPSDLEVVRDTTPEIDAHLRREEDREEKERVEKVQEAGRKRASDYARTTRDHGQVKPTRPRVVPGPPRGHSFSPGGGQSRTGNNPKP